MSSLFYSAGMEIIRNLIRTMLGSFMIFAGVGHFRDTASFMAQVPPFLPAPELIIYVSGVVEILLGFGLIFIHKYRRQIGIALAIFFVLIFPGNISQFLTATDSFGLNTDFSRFIRLLFQPVLIWAALWSSKIRH